ncbi:MAG TPA: hypothetical protein VHF92_02220 [Geodermatophilus sp.]|nr:hypothetical protein [Geodermatophilus sp.]
MSGPGDRPSFPASLGSSTADEIRLPGQDLTPDPMGRVGMAAHPAVDRNAVSVGPSAA